MAVHHVQSDTHHDRAVFISDTHHSTECCLAKRSLDLFRDFDTQKIYKAGGTKDGWPLKHGRPQPHDDVLQQSLRRARKGGRLICIFGKHDGFLPGDGGSHVGAIAVAGVRHTDAWTPSCRFVGARQARAA